MPLPLLLLFVASIAQAADLSSLPPKSCGILQKAAGTFAVGQPLRILSVQGDKVSVEPVADAEGCSGFALASGWSHEKNLKRVYPKLHDGKIVQATIDGPANLRDRPSGKVIVGSFANNANANVLDREGKWVFLAPTSQQKMPADGVATAPQETLTAPVFEPLFRVVAFNGLPQRDRKTTAMCGGEFSEAPAWYVIEAKSGRREGFVCSEGIDGMPSIVGVIATSGKPRTQQVPSSAPSSPDVNFRELLAVFVKLAAE